MARPALARRINDANEVLAKTRRAKTKLKALQTTRGAEGSQVYVLTEDELLRYFDLLSNWGRWGPDDHLGTINHITDETRRAAAGLIQKGIAVSCARTIDFGPTPEDVRDASPPQRFMIRSGEGLGDSERVAPGGFAPNSRLAAAAEYVGYAAHGYRITHLDGFSHAFWEKRMYNGVAAEYVTSHLGATRHGIENFGAGIVTRGVLVDVPRHRGIDWMQPRDGLSAVELRAILAAQAVQPRQGDALLLRTGYGAKRRSAGPDQPEAGSAGWDASCLPLFHDWQIAICGSDTAQDARPPIFDNVPSPIHAVGLVAMGMPLIDNADFEELARCCADLERWEFFFTVAPLVVRGGTSSAVNPLAIF